MSICGSGRPSTTLPSQQQQAALGMGHLAQGGFLLTRFGENRSVSQPASVGKSNSPRSPVEGVNRETSLNSLVLLLTQLAEETNAVKIHWFSRTVCKKVLWDIWKEGHGLYYFHS